MISISVTMGASIVLSKFVFKSGDEPFIMELPPYRIPAFGSVIYHMWDKAYDFGRMVGMVIVAGSVLIWFLQAFPREAAWSADYDAQISSIEVATPAGAERDAEITAVLRAMEHERMEKSYLGQVGQAISPVFEPLGFNWKDTVSIITGFLAKEMVVASYAVLYGQDKSHSTGSEGLRMALATAMTPVSAFALMVFLLLYSPCLSTMAAIKREAGGWHWAAFSLVFSLGIGWSLAFAVTLIGAWMF